MSEQRSEKEIIDEAYSDEAAKTWRAPVQGYPAGIPWPLHLEAYAAYCKRWSKQTAMIDLKGRHCRGGFAIGELDELVPGWLDRVSYIGRLEARIAELESTVACTVQTMQTSAGADYYVHLRMGDRTITPHSFKIWGRAAYEVEEWKWFFGQGDKPDLMSFDTDAEKPPLENMSGYDEAFFELAKLMDIPAQDKSPREVWESQMLPKLREALSPVSNREATGPMVEAAQQAVKNVRFGLTNTEMKKAIEAASLVNASPSPIVSGAEPVAWLVRDAFYKDKVFLDRQAAQKCAVVREMNSDVLPLGVIALSATATEGK